MHGVINLLKPPGMTSHDAVAFVRRVAGVKRVGHTGTLDPAAAGVLPICIGQATRLVEYLQAGRKRYIAEATFGYETDTLDAVGETLQTAAAAHITPEAITKVLPQFCGVIQQIPPMYSAIKQGGKKLYEIARSGQEMDEAEIKIREVEIFDFQLTRFWPGEKPRAIFRVECSGGTYIRSLVRDIARALDSVATMSFLVRTHSGHCEIDRASTLEQIAGDINNTLITIEQVLPWCAASVIVHDQAVLRLSQGRVVDAGQCNIAYTGSGAELVAFLNTTDTCVALARSVKTTDGISFKAEKVLDLGGVAA